MTTSIPEPRAESSPSPASSQLLPRLLGDAGNASDGPTLIVIGGLHGNEPAGVEGLKRVFEDVRKADCRLPGRLVGVTGNLAALEARQRFIDQDLNRVWFAKHLDRVRQGLEIDSSEDREIVELDAVFMRAIKEAKGTPFMLDIHTTSGPGPGFSVLHDTLPNRRFARAMSLPIALGLEEELNGTLTDHFTELGGVALSVEAGQHEDPHSIDRAEAAIWIAIDVAGFLPECFEAKLNEARELLEGEGRGLPEAVEVRYRHAIPPGAHFRMEEGFSSFQPVQAGALVASEDGKSVPIPIDGILLMPLYQALGEDGFFVTRPVRSRWLNLSTRLRHWRAERWVKLLPGVHEVPDRPGAYLVNRRVARFVARQIFHLLGFRMRDHSPTHLVMEKRPEPVLNGD